MDSIIAIPLTALRESPFNPRRTFNDKDLQELADDIMSQGILSPLLVRPYMPNVLRTDHDPADGYELVFGHRRLRAAKLAGHVDVPCMVRTMTNDQARCAQISENLSREDVHAIEEAEGFRALIDAEQATAEELATQFGKSPSYVYGRLKLLQAIPAVRKACLAGEYGADVALLIARLRTEKFQLKALEYIQKDYRSSLSDGGKQSYRSIRNLLNEKFTLKLKGALFDSEDADLVAAAGACSVCPKRSGNAVEFSDIANPSAKRNGYGMREDYIQNEGADVCTDPDCFDSKKAAHHKRRSDALAAQGKTVVDGNKARGAVSAHGEIKGAYISLAEVKSALPKAKGAKKTAMPDLPVVEILDPRTDKVYRAVKRDDLKAAGLKLSTPKKEETWQERQRRQDEERKALEPLAAAERAARMAAFLGIRAAVPVTNRSGLDTRLVARIAYKGVGWSGQRDLAKLWGKTESGLERSIEATMTNDDLTLFLLDCALIGDTTCATHNFKDSPAGLVNAANHYGVDLEDLRARALRGEALDTPTLAARSSKNAKAKGRPKAAKPSADAAGVDADTAANESQSVDAGSAGEEVKDEPADAVAERDPNTSDMFEGERA